MGVRLSKSSISEWLRGIHNPYNGRRIPSLELLKPSEELAYVIGVKVGDSVQITGLYRWGSPEITSRVEIDAPRQYLKPYLDTIRSVTDTLIGEDAPSKATMT
jgi:hypothetical protein